MALDVGHLVAYLEVDDSKYNEGLDRGESRFSRFGSFIGTAVKAGGAAILGLGTAAGAMGVSTAAGMEQAEIGFTTMLGSGQAAKAFLGDLSDFAAKTPFDLPGLQTAASSLVSAGVDASRVIPIMTSLGNATSGMGTGADGVKRATVALQQMNAAGKISMEDLNQLRDAGIPVYDLLAAALGKSKAEVADLANKGKLGRKELTQLMDALASGKGLERFAGLMDKQSQSLTGLWSTLKDTVSVGLANAIQPMVPAIKDGLGKAIQFATDKMPVLQEWIGRIYDGAIGLYQLVVHGDFTGAFSRAFHVEEDDEIVGKLFRIRDGIVGLYQLVVNGDFTKQFARAFHVEEDDELVGKIIGIRDWVLNLGDTMRAAKADIALFSTVLGGGEGVDTGQAGMEQIIAVATALRTAFQSAKESIGPFFDQLKQGDFTPITDAFAKLGPIALDVQSSLPAVNAALDTTSTVMGFVADHIDLVVKAMPFLLGAFATFKVAQAANNLLGKESLIGFSLRTAAMFTEAGATLALAAANRAHASSASASAAAVAEQTAAERVSMLTKLRSVAATVASTVASVAARAAAAAYTAVQWLLNAAMSANPIALIVIAIAALVAGLIWAYNNVDWFRNAVDAAWQGIQTAVSPVVDWFKTTVPAVFEFVKNAFLKYTPLGLVISHWSQIRDFIGAAVDRVKAIIEWFAYLPGMIGGWFTSARDAATSKLEDLVSFVTSLPGKILEAVGNFKDLLFSKGEDLIRGFIDGISNMGSTLVGFIKKWVLDHVPGPIADILGISSPSKVAADLLQWVPLGMVEGVKRTAPRFARAVRDLVDMPGRVAGPQLAVSLPAGSAGDYFGYGRYGQYGGDTTITHRTEAPVYVDKVVANDVEDFQRQAERTRRRRNSGELRSR